MPFGLCNAPATFERLMDRVLCGMRWSRCLVYLDDVISFRASIPEALARLEEVLCRLSDFGLQLKVKKFTFMQTEVDFLGHIVGRTGLACDPEKILAVRKWHAPDKAWAECLGLSPELQCWRLQIGNLLVDTEGRLWRCLAPPARSSQLVVPVRERQEMIHQFVGFFGYSRRFRVAGGASGGIDPEGVPLRLDRPATSSFEALKTCLISAPRFSHRGRTVPFGHRCQSLCDGGGGVLNQLQGDREVVIAYASRSLHLSQQWYCMTRREMLAAVVMCAHFRSYLRGAQFTAYGS